MAGFLHPLLSGSLRSCFRFTDRFFGESEASASSTPSYNAIGLEWMADAPPQSVAKPLGSDDGYFNAEVLHFRGAVVS